MSVLFIFLDGVGLGADNPELNPFSIAKMPNLEKVLGGRKLLADSVPVETEQACLVGLDAALGVPGLPQSATGQAVLLTGRNVPLEIGEHYGPKPTRQIADIIKQDNIFKRMVSGDKKAALLNAYPPRYFHGVESGKRLLSAIPLAVTSAGLSLFTEKDLYQGSAVSADFTGEGWRTMLGYADTPVFSPHEAGAHLASLAQQYDFSLFEYWASDYAGHNQEMDKAISLLESFDQVLEGLLSVWDFSDLILITSDHGNIENLSTRRHTLARVPGIVIGNRWESFCNNLADLSGVAGRIEQAVFGR